MYQEKRIGAVVPAYNEASFIGEVLDGIPGFVDRVFVVDDASTDGTWAEIRDRAGTRTDAAGITVAAGDTDASAGTDVVAASRPDGGRPTGSRIVPIRHRTNRGRGAAVKTGYRFALEDGIDIVAVLDGDGQMDPSMLDRIVDPVATGQADYAKGNRLASLDHCREMPGWRLWGNLLLTFLTMVASSYWRIRDPQNGYTAISADALNRLSLDELYDGYGFLNDVLIRLGAHGMCVEDVPTEAIYDEESSGIRYRTFVPRLSCLLLRGFLWRLWITYASE